MIFERYYILISLFIIAGSLAVVFARLDKRRTGVRRLTLISVMTALSIVSRFIFAALPAFKPMSAIVILTGVYLGPEAGFLCGALSAFLSNFYFGQGPWTPFQMAALGIIGFLAAILFSRKRNLPLLCLYGLLSGVFYSCFLDTWTMLWTYGTINGEGYLAALAAAIPYTILYSVSNVIFILLLDPPFGKRLGRIITKYRI
jgi:energy-coupling factor transport system substrate-specific component